MFRDTDALFVACKQNGLDVNAEKTKNIVMTPDHPAGQNHSRNMMEQFKDLETTLSNQNFIYEEIQSRFNSRKSFAFKFATQKHDDCYDIQN